VQFESTLSTTVFCVVISASPLLAAQELATDASFPAPGRVYAVSLGERQFRLKFDADGKTMTYTRPDGTGDTMQYADVEIRPQLFMVYWTEPKSGTRVMHIEDFEHGVVFANSARTDGTFIHAKGTLKRVE
jgi:hypothetical protein